MTAETAPGSRRRAVLVRAGLAGAALALILASGSAEARPAPAHPFQPTYLHGPGHCGEPAATSEAPGV